MYDKVTIEIPLPPRECSPNFRGHTRARARAIAQYRQDCFYLYKAAKLSMAIGPVRLSWDWYLSRPASLAERYQRANEYQPRDDDDAIGAVKAARDALQDAGVIPNDSRRYVRHGEVRFHGTAPEGISPRCIVLTIESALEAAGAHWFGGGTAKIEG